jgi:IMP dehydrogenase/GMP reductase
MKKIIFFVIVAIFTMSATMAFASKSDRNSEAGKSAVPVKTENKLSDEEVERITKRVEEIRKMDKSDLTSAEKSELKSELKAMKENVKKAGGTIYIGGATLLLIIILILLLV